MFFPDDTPQSEILLRQKDRSACMVISVYIIIQCFVVYAVAASILYCLWAPKSAYYDYDKLLRIMYLYDFQACGYTLHIAKSYPDLKLSNETSMYTDMAAIKCQAPIVEVSTRLSEKTRKYTKFSLALHIIWMLAAIVHYIFAKNCTDVHYFKFVLDGFFYFCIFILIFDVSMAIVYISHIKQSLNKNMVLRYSGWSANIKLESYDDFAGWLPIFASIMWLRGIVFYGVNIYCVRILSTVMKNLKKREVTIKFADDYYEPIPERQPDQHKNVLVFRQGEDKPVLQRF